jgi:hypothetical protein
VYPEALPSEHSLRHVKQDLSTKFADSTKRSQTSGSGKSRRSGSTSKCSQSTKVKSKRESIPCMMF